MIVCLSIFFKKNQQKNSLRNEVHVAEGGIICLFSSWNENKRSSNAMYYLIETVNLCYLSVTMSRITYTI